VLQQRRDLARHPVRFDAIALSPTLATDGSPAWHFDWLRHAFEAQG